MGWRFTELVVICWWIYVGGGGYAGGCMQDGNGAGDDD